MAYREHQNVTATDSLKTRLEISSRYAALDFHEWVMDHLAAEPNMDVLDVGCGTGVHALRVLDAVRPIGTVCAFDLAADSVGELQRQARGNAALHTAVSDMKRAAQVIGGFPIQRYDLAYSVYAHKNREADI
jgi:ubiquinone/menaquinone biosynthesis C-methylase UbiE